MPLFLTPLLDSIAHQLGMDPDTLFRMATTVLTILVFTIVQRLIARTVARTIDDRAVRYNAIKALGYVNGLVAAVVVAKIWIQGVAGIVTYLGLVSAGLAVALQEVIVNLVGFGFILWRRPFEVGDRIEIGQLTGDVVDIRLFQFTLLEVGNWVKADQSTGRVIHVPNGWVFRHATANYNKGLDHVWNELTVTVSFESNWRRAKELLSKVLNESPQVAEETVKARIDAAANRYFINYTNLTPIVWTSVSADGVMLTLRYLCDPRRRRSSACELWEKVLDEFAGADDIDFAYPTQRFFDNRLEGKTGFIPIGPSRKGGTPTNLAAPRGADETLAIEGSPTAAGAPHFLPGDPKGS